MNEIKINGKRVHNVEMQQPSIFHNVDVYASSIYQPVNGKIRNIMITDGIPKAGENFKRHVFEVTS